MSWRSVANITQWLLIIFLIGYVFLYGIGLGFSINEFLVNVKINGFLV